MRQAFEKYLECGIFAHGFARASCDDCGHDFLVAFSCKGRGVCPSCTTRRMARVKFRAAHLCDHVFPRLAGAPMGAVGAKAPALLHAALHIGAVAFIHRLGASLNGHVHFHVCVVDGVFEAVVGEASGQGTRTTATSAMFHPATGIACARMLVVLAQAYRQR